jgi:sphingomyelin phosphodiesterase acid-like 3
MKNFKTGYSDGVAPALSNLKSLRRSSLASIVLIGSMWSTSLFATDQVATEPVSAINPSKFMALSDIHFTTNVTVPPQYFCRHSCETESHLWNVAQKKAKVLVAKEKPEFIVYLGDLPSHYGSPDAHRKEFAVALDGLANIVEGTNTPMLYLPGNNDSVGGDYCTFTAINPATGKLITPLDFASDASAWPALNGNANIIDHNKVFGYYSVRPLGPGTSLRVIALNTTMFTKNYSRFGCADDTTQQIRVSTQLEWLNKQLDDAHTANEKVIIAMHVPAGIDGFSLARDGDYSYMWHKDLNYQSDAGRTMPGAIPNADGQWVQKVFLDLVDGHSDSIVSILSAHTHLNGVRRVNSCSSTMTALNLSIPAITTDHGSNSAMKVISYNNQFEPTEVETYYATKNAVLNPSAQAVYDFAESKSFTFSDAYPCPSGSTCDTLSDRVSAIDTNTLLNNMLGVLNVKRHRAGNHHYLEALDTLCNHYPNRSQGRQSE